MNLYNYNLYGDPALEVGGASAGVSGNPGERVEAAIKLLPAGPNPFASSTTLRFALAEGGPVRIAIHDVRGREVAVLSDSRYEAGEFSVTWDGTDGKGEPLGPGIYFASVRTGEAKAVRKMVLLK
jgi:hypothetical protein